jgi:hypothetical protein
MAALCRSFYDDRPCQLPTAVVSFLFRFSRSPQVNEQFRRRRPIRLGGGVRSHTEHFQDHQPGNVSQSQIISANAMIPERGDGGLRLTEALS